MRKDHDEIESGLGLEPARIKKLSKIQQGCVVYTWKWIPRLLRQNVNTLNTNRLTL
jgi:hypothetical protein